jgi:hypothetical protein
MAQPDIKYDFLLQFLTVIDSSFQWRTHRQIGFAKCFFQQVGKAGEGAYIPATIVAGDGIDRKRFQNLSIFCVIAIQADRCIVWVVSRYRSGGKSFGAAGDSMAYFPILRNAK